uniref:Uncharacterized protein n=1 Tax=Globisporangium ultimum (strain ATCC 200006 / CBS 805.95 / DAOM BR144) TaxID=431595 RepID=K3X6L0_GLOUD
MGALAFEYMMSHVIGFPLPFTLAQGVFVWASIIVDMFLHLFGSIIRENKQVQNDLSNALVLKSWISRFMEEYDDKKPEEVTLTVDFSNAFYVACCMQQSSSVSTTLVILFFDWARAISSQIDLSAINGEAKRFMHAIPESH